jgi:hypothetical protein
MKNRRWTWVLLAVLLFVVGSCGSVIGARTVAQNDHRVSQQTFSESSANIAGTLRLALQREQDLSVSARSFFIDHSDPTQAEFLQWIQSMSAFERYPELMGLAELKLVPASGLNGFVASKAIESSTGQASGGAFQIVPPEIARTTASHPLRYLRRESLRFRLGSTTARRHSGPCCLSPVIWASSPTFPSDWELARNWLSVRRSTPVAPFLPLWRLARLPFSDGPELRSDPLSSWQRH